MQARNGMMGGPAMPPMKRIKHTTTIEQPDNNGNGIPDNKEGGGAMSPGGFHGFLQNMVHPAFRTMAPGENYGPKPMAQNGVMAPFQQPDQMRIAPPLQTPGFNPVPQPQAYKQNPMQMDWGSLLQNMRQGGASPYLMQFLHRMAQSGMR